MSYNCRLMIQLQRLEGFYWVARTQGYSRAARAFPYPITQAGVFLQVQRLEEDTGLVLFERAGRDRVVLTAAGRRLFELVQPFYEELPRIVESIRTGTVGGLLRVQAGGLLLRSVLPAWLRRLERSRRDIDVALSEARAPDVNALRAAECDLLVDHLHEVPPDIEAVRVGELQAFVVVPSSHTLAKRRRVDVADLHGEPFVGYAADARSRELQRRALALAGVVPRASHSADGAETVLALVAAGVGLSIVPWADASGPRWAGVRAFRIQDEAARFPVYAAWWKLTGRNPLVEAFLSAAPTSSPRAAAPRTPRRSKAASRR